jgi:hypothetical protein
VPEHQPARQVDGEPERWVAGGEAAGAHPGDVLERAVRANEEELAEERESSGPAVQPVEVGPDQVCVLLERHP